MYISFGCKMTISFSFLKAVMGLSFEPNISRVRWMLSVILSAYIMAYGSLYSGESSNAGRRGGSA
jgi:flagellar biosynthesis protein FliP